MAFKDLFVPRIAHSNPEVRKKAVMRARDKNLLRQVIENDKDAEVRELAGRRLQEMSTEKATA